MNKCPHCNKWILTEHQKKILDYVQENPCLSKQVANKFKISKTSACNILLLLFRAGLLAKQELKQDSGGKEFYYFNYKRKRGKIK